MSQSHTNRSNGAIATIETETLTLVRALETLGRKDSLYVQMDRSGYLVLRTLNRLGPVSTNTLACALQLDASTITRQVGTLVKCGFVDRHPHPSDRRSSKLGITTSGAQAMDAIERERRRVLLEMFAAWDDERLENLGSTLIEFNTELIARIAALLE